MTLRRVEAPFDYPITLDEGKAQCRVRDVDTDDDLLILSLIAAATARAEMETGLAFMSQAWEWVCDSFPDGDIIIPLGPIVNVVSIIYSDEDGGNPEIPPEDFIVDTVSRDGRIVPVDAWPRAGNVPNAVVVQFEVGGGAPDDVRMAIKLMVGHWYEHREDATDKPLHAIPLGAAHLLSLHRRMFV